MKGVFPRSLHHQCKMLKNCINLRLHIYRSIARNFGSIQESHAVVLNEFGDPRKVLSLQQNEVSSPGENEVLVKMLMAPINPSDINTIEGTYHIRPKLPAVVGNEGVGEVISIGQGVQNLKIGDWVLPDIPAWGTWRQHAISSENSVQKIDNDIPVLSAATIMVNPCTAYRMLKDYENLTPGDVIIQNGANSAVGQFVIQIAKEWGIKTINIIRDRPDATVLIDHLKKIGATEVITEEFVRTPQMKDLMKKFETKPKLAFNCVGGQSATELIRYLKERGTMVTYGGMSKKPVIIPTGALIFKEIKVVGYWNTQWNSENKASTAKTEMYKDLCNMIRNSKLLTSPCEMTPLANFKEGIEKSLQGFKSKKQVLVINN